MSSKPHIKEINFDKQQTIWVICIVVLNRQHLNFYVRFWVLRIRMALVELLYLDSCFIEFISWHFACFHWSFIWLLKSVHYLDYSSIDKDSKNHKKWQMDEMWDQYLRQSISLHDHINQSTHLIWRNSKCDWNTNWTLKTRLF